MKGVYTPVAAHTR